MPLTDDVAVRRRPHRRADATEQRVTEILDAAAAAFAESGYTATSLRDVAARAGLSHTGLLHHFPDKAGLLEAVLDARMARAASRFPFETADGETFIRALVRATEQDVREPLDVRLWAVLTAEALAPGHPAHGYFARWYRGVRERLTAALQELSERGRYLGTVPPATAAVHLLTLRDGANLQWLLAPEEVDLVGIVTSQTRLYVDIDL